VPELRDCSLHVILTRSPHGHHLFLRHDMPIIVAAGKPSPSKSESSVSESENGDNVQNSENNKNVF
jgi:hypothetical protein